MSKILESDFRKELYKNLVDAGYNKTEATSIVSVKYSEALKEVVIGSLKQHITNIEEGKYDFTINGEELNGQLAELVKLQEFFKKNEKSS